MKKWLILLALLMCPVMAWATCQLTASYIPVTTASSGGGAGTPTICDSTMKDLSLIKGTYSDGKMCTYASSGTLLNCNTTIPTECSTSSCSLNASTTLNGSTISTQTFGTLTNNDWCSSNGTNISCTQAAPLAASKLGTVTSTDFCHGDGSGNVACTDGATYAANNQTMYIGTTSTAINRASAAQAFTGVTSIDNGTTGVTIATATTDKVGFFAATPVAQQTGNVCTALNNLGLTTSCAEQSLSGYLLATGATTGATSQSQVFTDGITLSASNIVTDATTGTSFGTATTQKTSAYGVTPVVQAVATTDLGTVLSNWGLRAAGTAYPITTSGTVNMSGTNTIAGYLPLSGGTLTGALIVTAEAETNNAQTVSSQTATCSAAYRLCTVTNNANSSVTITLGVSTPTPADGQVMKVRFYDYSSSAETMAWTNTENTTSTATTTSRGSTSIPTYNGFMYNSTAGKWDCTGVS